MYARSSTLSVPTFLRTLHFYLRRLIVLRSVRGAVISVLQLFVGRAHANGAPRAAELATLRRDGILVQPGALSETQIADILEYLSDKPVHELGAPVPVRRLDRGGPAGLTYGIYDEADVIDCPHVMEAVCSPEIMGLAASYLGCKPTLSMLGLQWSFPRARSGVAQNFHRDSEDWKYLRGFIYLTDVEEGGGPHVYVKGSHLDRLPLRLRFYTDEEIERDYGHEAIVKVLGKRGTFIAADTAGIHKGERPSEAPRLILTFTYSILPMAFERYRPHRSRHPSQMHNYTTRLYLRR